MCKDKNNDKNNKNSPPSPSYTPVTACLIAGNY